MGLIGLQDSYQDRLFFFNVHMYDEFHVPDVLIVLLYMWRLWILNSQGYWFKQKQSFKEPTDPGKSLVGLSNLFFLTWNFSANVN